MSNYIIKWIPSPKIKHEFLQLNKRNEILPNDYHYTDNKKNLLLKLIANRNRSNN